MNGDRFAHLLSPATIANVKIRNRIVMPAMGTNYGDDEGFVTGRVKTHFEKRAKGGAGLIIVGYTCVDHPEGRASRQQLSSYDDRFIPGLTELAGIIHRHGAAAALQLCHAGRNSKQSITGRPLVAASALAGPNMDMPRELSIAEIERIVEKFAAAALRARQAGFDAVELHATHGYLLHGFMSAVSNIREDAYGGSLRNRCRLILEVVRAIKARAGQDFPVWARLTAKEFGVPHGITLDDARQTIAWLEEEGVAAVNVSATNPNIRGTVHMAWSVPGSNIALPSTAQPYGYLVPLAAEIKKTARVPVIAIGRISPEAGECAIARGEIDFAAMGRQLICDPDLPNKIASGARSDIRPCVGCNECLQRLIFEQASVACSVNPVIGRENELNLAPAPKRKRVLVVGGGPAGLEAAEACATRGHEVIVLEKKQSLGGQLCFACLPPFKDSIKELLAYLTKRMADLNVKVELGVEATRERVLAYRPDALVIATGVKGRAARLPGAGKLPVFDAEEVLQGANPGEAVAIVGGGLTGCETAEYLAEKGKRVTIVEMTDILAPGMDPIRKGHLLTRMSQRNIAVRLQCKALGVAASGLVFSNGEGRREIVPCDAVVMATPPAPDQDLYRQLAGSVPEIRLAGDCISPRRIAEAMLEGFRAGCDL